MKIVSTSSGTKADIHIIDPFGFRVVKDAFASAKLMVDTWDRQVHKPFIRGLGLTSRADYKWPWRLIPRLAYRGSPKYDPTMLQMRLSKNDFPIGMVVLLRNIPWPLDPKLSSTYVYYLTAAPREAVVAHGGPKPLMQAIFDVALTETINGNNKGRLWLHADPAGATLPAFYGNTIGMQQIPTNVSITRTVPYLPRPNDGRYYFLDEKTALIVSAHMNGYR